MAGLFDCKVCGKPSTHVLEVGQQFVDGDTDYLPKTGYCGAHGKAAERATPNSRLAYIKDYAQPSSTPASDPEEAEPDSD